MNDTTGVQNIHATCVAIDGQGVLLTGPSGAGKSDLALRLIDGGAALVADDRVDLADVDGTLNARPPAALAGLMEVRGVGIVMLPYVETVPVALSVDLVGPDDTVRLPEPKTSTICGVAVRTLQLHAFEVSTPAKIRLALRAGPEDMVEA